MTRLTTQQIQTSLQMGMDKLSNLNKSKEQPSEKKDVISHLIIMGDSLSDRGTMDHRRLFDIIPMDGFSGLKGTSPRGRFTNGFTWSDYISAILASQFNINSVLDKTNSTYVDVTDISDAIINKDKKIEKAFAKSYSLDNDRSVKYKGHDFVRTNVEGGLTAHDYSWKLSNSFSRFFSRLLLSKLKMKRDSLLAYDKDHGISEAHKKQALIIEWSGANDLITVNARPSNEEADRAVTARIANAQALMDNGYQQFVLFNLPDLSLTPRYQNKGIEELTNAHQVSVYFNAKLKAACEQLQRNNPDCSIKIFDICSEFTKIHNNPEQYKFEKEKLKTPFRTSNDFHINENNETSPSTGYMFWDDVHPSADLHAILADKFYKSCLKHYQFSAPKDDITVDELLATFRIAYKSRLADDKAGYFGFFRQSNLDLETVGLQEIFDHAFNGGGNRTYDVIRKLGWINDNGIINPDIINLSPQRMNPIFYEDGKVTAERQRSASI